MAIMITQSEVLKANIEVHTVMADSYNSEPHFRPENQEKVKKVLRELFASCPAKGKGGKLLDMGCGTGFVINLVKDFVQEIHGVDITQAMLDRIDVSSGNITLHNSEAEKLPFKDAEFDMVTAYAFIHHLHDYKIALKEAYRVLKPQGVMYIDLEPNREFWKSMEALSKKKDNYSDIVEKEINAVLHTDDQVAKDFNIKPETFRAAEFTKAYQYGIDSKEMIETAKKIGFKSCAASYQWFLGQGNVSHQQSFEDATTIDTYLQRVLPLSGHLYKYLRFVLVK